MTVSETEEELSHGHSVDVVDVEDVENN